MTIFQRIQLRYLTWKTERLRAKRLNQLCMEYGVRRQAGFSLIELMIVVGIVALLMVLALPAYANFANRASVSEGIQLAHAAETAVSETYQNDATVAGNASEAGYISQQGKYVQSVTIGGAGVISVTYNATAPAGFANSVLNFVPYTTTDGVTISWLCGYATVPTGWTALTVDTAGSGNPAPAQTISQNYLPKACRTGT